MLYNCCVRIKFWIDFLYVFAVEAYTASWIEIKLLRGQIVFRKSRLIQPRGLKYITQEALGEPIGRGLYSLVDWKTSNPNTNQYNAMSRLIQPRGLKCITWGCILHPGVSRLIQPRGLKCKPYYSGRAAQVSRLIQPRGLKYTQRARYAAVLCRGLYSLVDWNWTEARGIRTHYSRSLYSLVDWNAGT